LGGRKPFLMVTDPPYGVEYDPDWRNDAAHAGSMGAPGGRALGKVENDWRDDWRETWALFPGDVAYVWHSALHLVNVANSLTATDFLLRSQIIWAKTNLAISRGHYHWQHEPCWYAVRKNHSAHWRGDRKQSTCWSIPKPQSSETGHSTQKPVECMRRPILNHTVKGDAVYDPFLGSGTTLVAAESTERICYGLELSPAYCDVIVKRWETLTGKTAVLEAQ
jgi:DNA modification methylase